MRLGGRLSARGLTDLRWVVVGTAGIVTFTLGCIGYAHYLPEHEGRVIASGPGPFDVVYESLALFVLGAPQGTGLPIPVEIARLLAPIVVGSAALIGLASLFRDRVQQMRIPLMRRHVVVCGLGSVGVELLRHLQAAGFRAVVIEADPANTNIQLCRSLRIPVIVGDAQQAPTLQAAGVQRAAQLLAVCPRDGINAEIVAVAQQLAVSRPGSALRCLAAIGDPELCALLRIQEANLTDDPSSSSLDFFNLDEISARLWLDDFPIDAPDGRPHVLISRLGGLGTWLVKQAAAGWYADRSDDTPLWITILDDHAEEGVRALVAQYPGLEPVCRFICSSTSVRDVRRLGELRTEAGAPPLTRAYVTADADEQAIEAALGLRHDLDAAVPLVVELWRTSGVGRLIGDARAGGKLTNIEMFPSLERTCTAELVQGGSFEGIAIALHEAWREKHGVAEPTPRWQELDESRRESSRAQARDISAKLRSIGCAIRPMRDWDASAFAFTDAEIETLAIAEHNRWIRERLEAGWQSAEVRDPENKKTPYLIPFDQLPPDIADLDRSAVRAIPAVLALADLQVVRVRQP